MHTKLDDKAFCSAVPGIWNNLPADLRRPYLDGLVVQRF